MWDSVSRSVLECQWPSAALRRACDESVSIMGQSAPLPGDNVHFCAPVSLSIHVCSPATYAKNLHPSLNFFKSSM